MNWRQTGFVVVLGALLAAGFSAEAQDASGPDVDAALQRIGAFVERYYSRAQSVVSEVRVRIRPMARDLSPRGLTRHLLYEMRVEWEPGKDDMPPDPIVIRDLLEANGRPPKPGDELECSDPRLVSPEPLAIFLPRRRSRFSFTWAGRGREAGRDAIRLDYRARGDEPPTVEWNGSCVTVDLPGMTRGRVWADAQSGEVLRLDEHLTGMFEFDVPRDQRRSGGPMTMTIERADTSIRYRSVDFSSPDETLLLPSSIEMMVVWRNAGAQRLFITHDFSNYRRFVTGSRIIRNPNRH
jgi:hypothetical protein